jgi:hypothetical protein
MRATFAAVLLITVAAVNVILVGATRAVRSVNTQNFLVGEEFLESLATLGLQHVLHRISARHISLSLTLWLVALRYASSLCS